jgi:SAM-dependent methyltransferase
VTERWSQAASALDPSDGPRRVNGAAYAPKRTLVPGRRRPPLPSPELALEDFCRYFPYTPTALAIKECARLSIVRRHPCPGPVLDVGCGDGLFARIAFENVEVWGIDIDASEGRWAAASNAYRQIILGDVTHASLPEAFFATCIANCSLEHVPRIDLALETILRSLRPGGLAYLFVPNAEWARHFTTVRVLEELGAGALGAHLRHSIDRFFKHHHLYDEAGWRDVVLESGLEVVDVEPVLSTATTVAFEAFLLPSVAGWLNKHMTTRWTNFPGLRRAFATPVYRAVRALMDAADRTPTAEFLVIARRPER